MQIEQPSDGRYTIPIRWYFAPPGAKTFFGLNAFSSGIWDRDQGDVPLLGEQPPYAYPWDRGDNPQGYLGQCMIGTPTQFAEGMSAAALAAPILQIPLCCKPRVMRVGELDGATQGHAIVILTAGEIDTARIAAAQGPTIGAELDGARLFPLPLIAGELDGGRQVHDAVILTAGELDGGRQVHDAVILTAGELDGAPILPAQGPTIGGELDGGRQVHDAVILTAGELDGAPILPAQGPTIGGELDGGRQVHDAVILTAGELDGAEVPASADTVTAGELDGAEVPASADTVTAGEIDGVLDQPGDLIYRVPLGSVGDAGPVASVTITSVTTAADSLLIVNVIVHPLPLTLTVTYDGIPLTSPTGNLTLPGTTLNYFQFTLWLSSGHTGAIVVSSSNPLSAFLVNALSWENLQGSGSTDQIVQASGTAPPPTAGTSAPTGHAAEGVSAAVAAVYTGGSVSWGGGFVSGGQNIGATIGGANVVLLESFKVLAAVQTFTPSVTGLITTSWVAIGVSYF